MPGLKDMRILSIVMLASLLVVGCPPPGGGGKGGDGSPSQTILDMETETSDLINGERALYDLGALTMREDLRQVARAHSQDMVDHDFFAHVNPSGDDPFHRMAGAGITYSTAGENIAWNNYPNSVETAVDGWMNSAGHRNNILNANFTMAGLGVAHDGAGGYYFTQVFTDGAEDAPGEYVYIYYDTPIAQSTE